MQVRVLSTAPAKPCDYYNHRVFSYHFAGIKTECEIRKHRKQSKNLKKKLVALCDFFRLNIQKGEKGRNKMKSIIEDDKIDTSKSLTEEMNEQCLRDSH